MAKVICIGVAVVDAIFSVPEIPKVPVKVMAHGFEEVGGGMAATGAVAIRRLGGNAAVWGRLGADDVAERVVAGLEAEGVDTRGLRRFEGRDSTHAAVLVDPQGERLLVGYSDPSLEQDPSWLPLDELDAADAVLADPQWGEGAACVLERAGALGLPSVLDCDMATKPTTPRLIELASHTIFSEVALGQLAGDVAPGEGLRACASRAGGLVGVTLGERGFLWLESDGRLRHQPAAEVNVVDTLGAGDVFHGAYALGLAEGLDTVGCARLATAAAGLKCTRPGGRNGAPAREETEALAASLPPAGEPA